MRTKVYRLAALPLTAAALLAVATPAHATTFGSLHCDPSTNPTTHRTLKLCAQVEELNGRVRADVSIHCLNAAQQEYGCRWIKGGVIWLYRDGSPLVPQSGLECGHDGLPGCGAPAVGYSLNDPNPPGVQTYRAKCTATEIQTFDTRYTNLSCWSVTVFNI